MATTSRVLTLLAYLACAHVANAQVVGGTITGSVTDEQGRGVPGVTVTAHGVEQSQLFRTDSDGEYHLRGLVPGRYVLTAALDGFTTIVRNGVMVRVNKTANLPLVMKVVRMAETVTVTAPFVERAERADTDTDRPAALLPSRNLLQTPPAAAILVERVDRSRR
jgi:hypothetical protein